MAYMTDENGNYKRTVRCGHCYEKGHNKSACPKRVQDLKDNIERYSKALAEDKFRTSYDRECIERYLKRSKEQIHKIETRGQNRSCGFCREPGHTRRTCPDRKQKVAEGVKAAVSLRKAVAQRMQTAGFGPGALLQVRSPRGSGEVLAVVTHVDFVNMRPSTKVSSDSYFDTHRGVSFQYVVPMEDTWGGKHTNGSSYVNLAYMNVDNLPEAEWYRSPNNNEATLLSGVEVSEDQLLCEDAVDEKAVSKWIIHNVVDPK